MKSRSLIAAIVLALAAIRVGAQPLSAEKDSLRLAFEGARYFAWSEYWIGTALEESATHSTMVQREALAMLVQAMSRSGRDWENMAYGLAAGDVERARASKARGINDTLPSAIAALQNARRYSPSDQEYQEALAIAGQLLEGEALPRFRRVDVSLEYASPFPQGLLPEQTLPAFIGPHGDYLRGVDRANAGTNYAFDEIDEGWLPFYRGLRSDRRRWDAVLGRVFRGYGYGLVQQYLAYEIAFGLSGPEDRFCAVLDAAKRLTDARRSGHESLAETLVAVTWDWAELVHAIAAEPDPLTREHLASAHRRFAIRNADWWGNAVDAGSWSLFDFANEPQKTRCGL